MFVTFLSGAHVCIQREKQTDMLFLKVRLITPLFPQTVNLKTRGVATQDCSCLQSKFPLEQ